MTRLYRGKYGRDNRTDVREVAVFRPGKSKKQAKARRPLTNRVREDVAPRMNEMMHTASVRTAPMRAEARARGNAAWSALRGDYPKVRPVPKQKKRRGRGVMIGAVGTAAAAGAAAWAAAKRSRTPEWVSAPEQPAAETPMAEPARQAAVGATPADRGAASPDEMVADKSYGSAPRP